MPSQLETWIRGKARRAVDGLFCSSSGGIRRIGDQGSGWVIQAEPLPRVAYCAGVGKGMSFELELANMTAGCVLVFDPSPTGINTVEHTDISKVTFYPIGLAAKSAVYEFSLPADPGEGSYSVVREGADKATFQCWDLDMIMKRHNHSSIDLLKMDIEGFEYDIIERIIEGSIPIRQICVEFHPWLNRGRTLKTITNLYRAGYRIIHKHRGDYTFLLGARN